MKKKILFLVNSLQYGGAERQMVVLAKGLSERGHQVSVVVFRDDGPLAADLKAAGISVTGLKLRRHRGLLSALWRLVHAVRSEKPDILHGYLGGPNIMTILLKGILPYGNIVWGVRSSYVDLSHYGWLDRLTYQVERLLSGFADHIIINSQTGFEYAALHGFPRKKMVVIPNGIDSDKFHPDLALREEIRSELKVSSKEKLIGIVGRLDPMKGYEIFIKAAALLAKKYDNSRFVSIGEGLESYKSKLKSLTEKLGLEGRFIWAGGRTEMTAVYNAMDIVSSSSSFGEGFPNVIGEAMACGVPCVVTDVGDSAYVVSDTGIVVPPRDPEALAEGMRKLIDSDLTSLGLKARQRIVENFNVDQLVSRTEDALKRLC